MKWYERLYKPGKTRKTLLTGILMASGAGAAVSVGGAEAAGQIIDVIAALFE